MWTTQTAKPTVSFRIRTSSYSSGLEHVYCELPILNEKARMSASEHIFHVLPNPNNEPLFLNISKNDYTTSPWSVLEYLDINTAITYIANSDFVPLVSTDDNSSNFPITFKSSTSRTPESQCKSKTSSSRGPVCTMFRH